MKKILRTWFFRKWYWFISNTDKRAEVLFMNFGYHNDSVTVALLPGDEKNRYPIQLYHQLALRADLELKDICEVGSGRGGGLAWIHKTFNPKSSIGVDLNPQAVKFCNQYYLMQDLRFEKGDAQSLPLTDNSFDIVLNVESSHRYPSFELFLSEAYRILRDDGTLLFTDFRRHIDMDAMNAAILASDFHVMDQEIITPCILKALELDDARRRDLVKRLVPKVLQNLALNFAGAKGTETYHNFSENKFVYFVYVLKKKLKPAQSPEQ